MFGREVRAPVDLVFNIPAEDPPASYDSYTIGLEDRKRQTYNLVRLNLGVTSERMKRQYDLRVRPSRFHRGEWVLYYNPRKFQGRQQKWQRKFSPYLVVKELPPVNYLIQKTRRSRPMVAHVDKLKSWNIDNPPRSWLTDDHMGESREDLRWSAGGDVIPGTVNPRNAGEQADDDGDVVLHVNDSGHSEGVVVNADPRMVDADDSGGSGVASLRVNGQEDPGLVDGGVNGGQHGPGDVVGVVGQGTSSGQVADGHRGPGILVDVRGGEGTSPRVDDKKNRSRPIPG